MAILGVSAPSADGMNSSDNGMASLFVRKVVVVVGRGGGGAAFLCFVLQAVVSMSQRCSLTTKDPSIYEIPRGWARALSYCTLKVQSPKSKAVSPNPKSLVASSQLLGVCVSRERLAKPDEP